MANFSKVYLSEINTQIKFTEKAYKEFSKAKQYNNIDEIFYHAHHIFIHASNIQKILGVDSNHFRSQYIKFLPLKELSDNLNFFREIRNDLEHFDERLDSWIKNAKKDQRPLFDMNLTTGSKGFPMNISLRTLDGNEFYFYEKPYNIDTLISNVREIKSILQTHSKH